MHFYVCFVMYAFVCMHFCMHAFICVCLEMYMCIHHIHTQPPYLHIGTYSLIYMYIYTPPFPTPLSHFLLLLFLDICFAASFLSSHSPHCRRPKDFEAISDDVLRETDVAYEQDTIRATRSRERPERAVDTIGNSNCQ